ncbi:MAG TPA: hypothetical protein VFQ72_03930 [Candidatus Paceibacterota bacterium]|nr:hypothetical protein [Candidatus Paceibacterota bacterium]
MARSRGYESFLRRLAIARLMANGDIDSDVWYELYDTMEKEPIKRVAMTRATAHRLNKRLKLCGFLLVNVQNVYKRTRSV